MLIDPWGKKLADTEDQIGFAQSTLERKLIQEIRAKLPALTNRKKHQPNVRVFS